MVYRIEFKSSVSHDLKKLDKTILNKILPKINEFLSANPQAGERLHGEFAGLYKMRFGEYRVVYSIINDTVLVLRIRHRSKVYEG